MRGLDLATCDRALPPAGAAPEWVQLLPPGKMTGRDGRTYELADPGGLILAFQCGGIDLPVDYEHPQRQSRGEAFRSGPGRRMDLRIEWRASGR